MEIVGLKCVRVISNRLYHNRCKGSIIPIIFLGLNAISIQVLFTSISLLSNVSSLLCNFINRLNN